jgi:hypothetical protein
MHPYIDITFTLTHAGRILHTNCSLYGYDTTKECYDVYTMLQQCRRLLQHATQVTRLLPLLPGPTVSTALGFTPGCTS